MDNPYLKFLAAVVGAVVVAFQSAISDNVVTNPEWVQILIAGFTAISVWLTANVGSGTWTYAKAITAGILAALSALASYVANDTEMTTSMWINVAIALVTAAVVYAVPKAPVAEPSTPPAH